MLDHLHQRCRVVARKPPIAVDQRALEETDAALLIEGQPSSCEPARAIWRARCETSTPTISSKLRSSIEEAQQPTLTAAEVEHPARPELLQRRQDCREALPVQPDPLLDRLLFLRVPSLVRVRVELILLRQSGEGVLRQ